MDLLTAVNRILPVLGEHPVTSISTKQPTVALILPKIENKIEDLSMSGYWFNTFKVTLYPDAEGEVALPANTLSFVADVAQAVQRGRKLYNAETMSFVFAGPVAGILIQRLPFDELPESVASLVWYSTLVDVYVTDIGLESSVQVWQREAAQAERRMLAEHLKNMRYSTTRSPRFARLRSALRSN